MYIYRLRETNNDDDNVNRERTHRKSNVISIQNYFFIFYITIYELSSLRYIYIIIYPIYIEEVHKHVFELTGRFVCYTYTVCILNGI